MRYGFFAVALLVASLALLIGWQTCSGLDHAARMMDDRSTTLHRILASEVRAVARYGAPRSERLDSVLREVTASGNLEGALLERVDGRIRFMHGELPLLARTGSVRAHDRWLAGTTLVVSGPVRIDTRSYAEAPPAGLVAAGAPAATATIAGAAATTFPFKLGAPAGAGDCLTGSAHGCALGCAGGATSGLDGDYGVTLAIDARPYLRIRRSVWLQGMAGALLVAALAVGLLLHQRQMRRHAETRQALALADERARSLESLSLVAGGLAHEIKSPLGALRGFAQLIAEKAAPESPEAEYAALMVTELDAITRRVDGLRHLTRPSPASLRPGHPAAILRRIAALLGPDLGARGLTLALEAPAAPGPKAHIDEDRLRDLIVNLLMNAVEASPRGATVTARLRLERDPAEREHVLRPFYSTKTAGLGLGLALARRAAQDHGGHLEITDAPGGGALVRATWPRRPGRA